MLAALDGLGKIFDSIRANVYKEAMTAPTITVFVCLGSNTPDAAHMLSLAVERLRALPRARVDALSDIYLTEPQDYADQPWFHNQVVRMELETDWTPQSFVRALLAEEKTAGQTTQQRSGPALRTALHRHGPAALWGQPVRRAGKHRPPPAHVPARLRPHPSL